MPLMQIINQGKIGLAHFLTCKRVREFKGGDRVRHSLYASPFVDPNKLKFCKGYSSRFTKDVYTVVETDSGSPHMYRLGDTEGDLLPGRYYEPELSLFTGETVRLVPISLGVLALLGKRKEKIKPNSGLCTFFASAET